MVFVPLRRKQCVKGKNAGSKRVTRISNQINEGREKTCDYLGKPISLSVRWPHG